MRATHVSPPSLFAWVISPCSRRITFLQGDCVQRKAECDEAIHVLSNQTANEYGGSTPAQVVRR